MKHDLLPMKTCLYLLSICFLTSCNPIMMKMYGIKDPEVENEKTIRKSALKHAMDTSNIVTVYSRDFPQELKGKGIPDAAVYDASGKYIEYRRTDTSCNAGLFQFIPDLALGKTYNQPDSADLATHLSRFRDMRGNKLKSLEKADFYVLIYWSVWTGKLNKDHVKVWEDLAKNNKNCNIKVIKVNLDFQEYWDEADKEKIVGAMKKNKK